MEPADLWRDNSEIIRHFLGKRRLFVDLATEGEYILRARMEESQIQFAQITSRAKTLESFLEKISRKAYENPLEEITDLAGVRLVYLYNDDRENIERVIEKEFVVKEKTAPASEKDINYFGYEALHYVASLGENCRGARYDALRELNLEIQVRTVLQDAWALIAHHLVYKRESDIPEKLQRKLNRLVGLFETADEQFTAIRAERERYIAETRDLITDSEVPEIELNVDSLEAYCKQRFPGMRVDPVDLSMILYWNAKNRYKTIQDLDQLVQASQAAINEYLGEDVPELGSFSTSLLNLVVAIHDQEYYKTHPLGWSEQAESIIKKYKHW